LLGNGVLHLISCAIQAFSEKGEGIIISTPAYMSFLHDFTLERNDRIQVINKLSYSPKNNQYQIN